MGIIWLGGAMVLGILALIWRPLFAATVNRELAEAEEHEPGSRQHHFHASDGGGHCHLHENRRACLLITAMLIIPAAAARRFASGPEQMAILAAVIGAASVVGGLFGSLEWDTPAGPSIVVAALGLFVLRSCPGPPAFASAKDLTGRQGEPAPERSRP
jgi:zinc transport system permease protein